ncbi:MAG: zinc ribbon domain-containing protein [Dehalococcoidia bacterium]
MSDLLAIMTLQEIDDALDALRAALAAAQAQLEGDPDLVAAREDRDSIQAELDIARKSQRAFEANIQDLDARIARDEARMYDGSVKTPRDLATVQHEVDGLRASRSEAEDQALAVITGAESLAQRLVVAESTVSALEAAWKDTAARLESEVEAVNAKVAAQETERADQVGRLTAANVRLYDALRKRKGPNVVVRVGGSSCGGCRVAIPEPVRRRIINSPTLVQCPHCERILAPG